MRTHQLPKRVYWRRNCYQYKATDLDRLHGMTAWVRHSTEAHFTKGGSHVCDALNMREVNVFIFMIFRRSL